MIVALLLPLVAAAQGFDKVKKRADAGNADAMVELHHYYLLGFQTAVDTNQAIDPLERASAAGNHDAKAWLSRLMLYSRADTAAAVRLADEAAAAGSQLGRWRQAIHRLDGVGCQQNCAMGKMMLEKCAQDGCQQAALSLGWLYVEGSDSCDYNPVKAVELASKTKDYVGTSKYSILALASNVMGDRAAAYRYLKKGLAVGDANAWYNHVLYQFYGIGTAEDEHAAMQALAECRTRFYDSPGILLMESIMRWQSRDPLIHDTAEVRRLLERIGDAPSIDNYARLGESYLEGQFTGQDSAKAYRYLMRGAAKGDVKSMEALAAYQLSLGNSDSCRYWLDKALANGSNEANSMYSRAYTYGAGDFEHDYAKALPYALEAGRRGDMQQLVHAGKLHLYLGDTLAGRNVFMRAVDLGYYDACVNLADLDYDQGNARWADWLKKGAKKGNSACLNTLGDCYGGEENYKQAARCYEQAGDPRGYYGLGRLYWEGEVGNGGEADTHKGLSLLRKAENAGYSEAVFYMAGIFEDQEAYDSVLPRLRLLVDNNYVPAMLHMARYCEKGLGMEVDSVQALDYYRLACDNGVSLACDILGDRYRYGQAGLVANPAIGFVFYNQAAGIDEDNAYGLYDVAECYMKGVGTHVDTAKALAYLYDAFEAGSYAAAATLGDFYWDGLAGMPVNRDTALHYYHIASMGDHPRGDYMMGAYLYDNGAYDNAIGFLVSAASNGSVDAQVLLARALIAGQGIDASVDRGVDILRSKTDIDSSGNACLYLAMAIVKGYVPDADSTDALNLIERAVAMGNTRAMTQLGLLYASGIMVGQDTVRSVELYEQAAAAGNEAATLQLAGSYMSGRVAPHNPKRAAELYQMAADRGSLDGMCRLGLCYAEGEGVTLNSRRAYNLYMQAAEAGSAWAMRLVAICYAQGIYVEENMAEAAKWMLRSAEAGDAQAAFVVGQLYAAGDVLKKSKKEAKRWLRVAAEAGHEGAAELLGQM